MDELLEIGEVVKPQGLRGRMKALSYLDSEDILQGLDEVLIQKAGQPAASFKLKNIQRKKNYLLFELDGIHDVDAVLNLVGSRILVPEGRLKKLPEGEYYWRELIGLRVITETGDILGRIESIFPTGSNDVYVCKSDHREILLPAIGEVIREVDIKKGMMVVRLLEGL